MNHAVTWDEVARGYQTDYDHRATVKAHKLQSEQNHRNFVALAAGYINHSWADYIIEDADGNLYAPKENKRAGFGIGEACAWMAKHEAPFRITRAVHHKGSGILLDSPRRVVVEKPTVTVWFINYQARDPHSDEKKAEMHKNLKLGLPIKLASMQYGINISTVSKWCRENGVKCQPVKDD